MMLLLSLTLPCLSAAAATPTVVHVDASGLTAGAYTSLPAARDHIRTVRGGSPSAAASPYTVMVHPGTYPPFTLDAVDSGADEASRIAYMAVPGAAEPAVISAASTFPRVRSPPWGGTRSSFVRICSRTG